MQENRLTERDRKLMVKYGFVPQDAENGYVPSASTVFAYRTFMVMKGDQLENSNCMGNPKSVTEFKSKKIPE